MIAENVTIEARLIDDLLDISRITHHKLPLDLKFHDINSLLTRAADLVKAEVKEKDLTLTTRFEASPAIVKGDEVRLHQIFWNLVRNAVKFTPRGGRVAISTRVHADRPGTLVIEIQDTGIGLTAGEQEKIFTPFVQGEHTREGVSLFGGLGLGLAISSKIAELHGGCISAQSLGRNRGAIFSVELPLEMSGEVPRSPSPVIAKSVGEQAPAVAFKVLLVEDHESSREALARLLTRRKLELIQAASAGEALEKAKVNVCDLVISDIGLPDTTGLDLMATLKATYGWRGIALSGYGTERDIALSKEAGFMAHLTKPIKCETLYEALDLALNLRS